MVLIQLTGKMLFKSNKNERKKVDSQKHSVPRKFLKGVAAMPEKMLNAELMGREVSNANNREQAIESERKQKLIQKQKKQNDAKISDKETEQDGLQSKIDNFNQSARLMGLDIESGELQFGDKLKEIYNNRVTDLSDGNYNEHGKRGLLNDFPDKKGNDFNKLL